MIEILQLPETQILSFEMLGNIFGMLEGIVKRMVSTSTDYLLNVFADSNTFKNFTNGIFALECFETEKQWEGHGVTLQVCIG